MAGKMYRSSQGKSIDLGSLLLQNENVRAVGNMGVNARGDVINNKNKSIDSRVNQKKRQYNKQIGPQDVVPSESKTKLAAAVADEVVVDPVVVEPKKTITKKPKTSKTKVTKPKVATTEKVKSADIDINDLDNIESNLEKAEETKSKPVGGLAEAIARAKRIKQEAIVPPKERAKQAEGVKKI
ncbi:MAG: hypothetical protein ISQ22_09190 [Rhizobiales bacterium]|nr:hypothetical protein [Hyphomicrobiales bacterium]